MIKSLADRLTKSLFEEGSAKGVNDGLAAVARRKLDQINAAVSLGDLRIPPGNRLKRLQGGDRWAIRVNERWRITFEWRDGDAQNVKFEDHR